MDLLLHPAQWLATDPTQAGWLNYGVGGFVVLVAVIPLLLFVRYLYERIIEDKNRQLEAKDAEILRQRGELADLRRVLDPIAPAITESSRVMNMALGMLTAWGKNSGGGG